MILGKRVVAAAREQLGVRYRDRSAAPGLSLCCYGLVWVVARSLGVSLPTLEELGHPSLSCAMEFASQHLEVLGGEAEGALVLMASWGQTGDPQVVHWGVLTERKRGSGRGLVHSIRAAGQVLEEPYSRSWQRITKGFYALPG